MLEYLRRRSTPPSTLIEIITDVRSRWRLKLALRGVVRVTAVVAGLVLLAAYGMEWARFSSTSVLAARVGLLAAFAVAAYVWLVKPLQRKVTDEQVALYLEEHEPSLQATLVSAVEASQQGRPASAALVQRVVEQAVEKCASVNATRTVEARPLRRYGVTLAAVAVAALLAVLVGPAFIRQALSAMFLVTRIEAAVPYRIDVTPGTLTVPKGADQTITARLFGFEAEDPVVMVKRTPQGEFEALPLVLNQKGEFEGMIFDVTAALDYYVEADGVKSQTFALKVVDVPYVQTLQLEYHFPAYTGLEPQKIEDGGDIAVTRGTEVRLRIVPTMKVPGGRLAIDEKTTVALALQADGSLTGRFVASADGFYRVELQVPSGDYVIGSPQYTIDVLDDQAPTISFVRPGRDTQVSAIEEVFVEARAQDDFGVRDLELVYSVNGGPEKTVKLFEGRQRLPEVMAGHTFYLEELGVAAGDSVSYYARAMDNDGVSGAKRATSDLYFLRIRPFSKDFRQAQSQGGGGGGGGGGGNQVGQLSEQQRQVISATFNVQRDRKTFTADKLRQNSNIVSLSQSRLREQVEGLLTRMNSQLVQRDPAFQKIAELLPQAVTAMKEAEAKLAAAAPDQALPAENKALQFLQKAEEEYELQVSAGQQGGGGGGGGGSQMQQELAELFEQDAEKLASRYETASQASEQQGDREVDELLEKLKELARRQEQEAERQRSRALQGQSGSGGSSGAQQRALAEQVEEAARRLERLAREEQRQDLAESARQMRDAAEAMRRAAAGGQGQGASQAQAALERLRETERRLRGAQSDRAERDIAEAKQQADDLARQQAEIAGLAQQLPTTAGPARTQQGRQINEKKDALEAKLGELEARLDRASRDASAEERAASRRLSEAAGAIRDNRLRDRVRYSRVTNRAVPQAAVASAEGEIAAGIDEVRRKLDDASAAIGQNPTGDKQEQALDRARRLARAAESLQARTRERAEDQARRGQQGQGQGDEQGRGGEQGQSGGQGDQDDQQGQGRDGRGQQTRDGQRGQGQGQGQRGQNSQQGQQGQRGQQGQAGQSGQNGQQGQGGQGGQGQQGQSGQSAQGGGQGQGNADQGQAGQQAGDQGGGGRNGGFATGGVDRGGAWNGEAAWGGWWNGGRLTQEDIRQLRGEARQFSNDARELRGLLRGENIDPKELDQLMGAIRQLEDDRTYQNVAELARLQSFVAEGLKRFEFGLRRKVDADANAAALTGTDAVPPEFRALVEQYYRSLSRSPR